MGVRSSRKARAGRRLRADGRCRGAPESLYASGVVTVLSQPSGKRRRVKVRRDDPGFAFGSSKNMDFKGKKVIALGERDGIQGSVIKGIAEELGAHVVFSITQCFV